MYVFVGIFYNCVLFYNKKFKNNIQQVKNDFIFVVNYESDKHDFKSIYKI